MLTVFGQESEPPYAGKQDLENILPRMLHSQLLPSFPSRLLLKLKNVPSLKLHQLATSLR